ncbi:SPOSA6832_04190, partial [Sporobolomyces salmonicolor]
MGLSSIVSKASAVVAGSASSTQSAPPGSPSSASAGSASPKAEDKAPEGASADDTEVLDDEPKNMLLALVGQLRVGMDLSKITLPVFVLEPRSMLERVTDFHSHPEMLHNADSLSAEERFIRVLKYYLAGWHIKPKGVKKPYNPVLGEFFRCRYDYPDGTAAYYVAEQVSHHPPISAWYFSSPENGLDLCGELRPKSKFLGNSAATIMEGESHVRFLDGEAANDGEYDITMPNMCVSRSSPPPRLVFRAQVWSVVGERLPVDRMTETDFWRLHANRYARGILFGKMVLELGDSSIVRNNQTGMTCEVEFKTKGFFSGSYNSIAGKIKGPKGDIGDISGHWSDVMEISRKGSKGKEVLFNAHDAHVTQKSVAPEDQQLPNESRRLWSKVTSAIKAKDLDAATEAKTAIEDAQREAAREREEKGETFQPKFFKLSDKGEWRPNFSQPSCRRQTRSTVRQFVYGSDPEPASAVAAPAPA